jgi:cytochrome c-type biogenesis protein CcmH
MMKKSIYLLFIVSCVILMFSVVPARSISAQQPTPSDDEVNAIASQLFCPVCQNTPLDVCPTQACRQWRDLIRQMLAEGKSAAEIKQYFVTYYGASVLPEPPRSGFNWLIYIVPPVAFLLGVFLLFQAFHTWKKAVPDPVSTPDYTDPSKPCPGSGSSVEDPYISQLEDELKKRT